MTQPTQEDKCKWIKYRSVMYYKEFVTCAGLKTYSDWPEFLGLKLCPYCGKEIEAK